MAKACNPWSRNSWSESYTSRWRWTRVKSLKFGEAILTLKWLLSPDSLAPAWPACWALSSMTSKNVGWNCSWSELSMSACQEAFAGNSDKDVFWMLVMWVLFKQFSVAGFGMLGNVKAGAKDECEWKYITPYFEVDPFLRGVVISHIGIEGWHEDTVKNPGSAEGMPLRIFQFHLAA